MISVILTIFLVFFVSSASLMLHEFAHAFAAHRNNVRIKEISLGVGPKILQFLFFKIPCSVRLLAYKARTVYDEYEQPLSWQKRAYISLAGPLSNCFIAVFCLILYVVFTGTEHLQLFQDNLGFDATIPGLPYLIFSFHYLIYANLWNVLLATSAINFIFFFFTMLPIIESDGGKVIFHYLDHKKELNSWLCLFIGFSRIFKNAFHLFVLFLSFRDLYFFADNLC
jgi:Zn-dependent protease